MPKPQDAEARYGRNAFARLCGGVNALEDSAAASNGAAR
jgi:hypothetical protein